MNTKRMMIRMMMILLACLLLAGCARQKVVLEIGEAQNGQKVELALGQVLVVTLDSNVTTGYSWAVADTALGILEQDGETVYTQPAANQNRVGAGGRETLRFKTMQAGQGTLRLEYRRPWEKDAQPAQVFEVEVLVQ